MRKVKNDIEAMKFLYKIHQVGARGRFQINSNSEGITVSITSTDVKYSKSREYKEKYSTKTVWEAVNMHIGKINASR